jgi:hypothetical protein
VPGEPEDQHTEGEGTGAGFQIDGGQNSQLDE